VKQTSQAAECDEGFIDLGAAVVANKQPLEVVQPGRVRWTTQRARRGRSLFGLATGDLRCGAGSRVDPAYTEPTPPRVHALPVERAPVADRLTGQVQRGTAS
jgi:hypothetical protein